MIINENINNRWKISIPDCSSNCKYRIRFGGGYVCEDSGDPYAGIEGKKECTKENCHLYEGK